MYRTVKVDSHFIPVNDKIVETILSYGDELDRSSPVRADHTRWRLHEDDSTFNYFIEKFNEIYPKYYIEELWGCTYRQGDFAQAHNHHGFDRGLVWFVDTSPTCSPLVFPDPEHPWMPPLRVITPETGKIIVFSGMDLHYVPPQVNNYERTVLSANMRLNKKVH